MLVTLPLSIASLSTNFHTHKDLKKKTKTRFKKPRNLSLMAKHHFPLLLVLLLSATFTSNYATIFSPSPTPKPKQTPTHSAARNPSKNITRKPPLPPEAPAAEPTQDLKAHRQQQFNRIVDALTGAGDFNSWANILALADTSVFPLSATLFIPADDDLSPPATVTADPFIFPYHIVPQRLSFAQLRRFKLFSRLPTLLPAKSILITNNSVSNFTLDGSLLSHSDLYITATIAVHGVATVMDYSVYGDGSGRKPPKPKLHRHPSPPPPPGKYLPVGEMMDHNMESDAACLCTEVWTFFLAVFAVFASKIHRINLSR